MTILTQTTAFNLDDIEPGHLIVLRNSGGQVFASGIVVTVNPMVLQCMIFMSGSTGNTDEFNVTDIIDSVSPYALKVSEVIEGKIHPTICDPKDWESF